jgi:cytochrome c-type biogenesis protein CcmH/NrfG
MRYGRHGCLVAVLLLYTFNAQAKTASEVFDAVSPSVVTVLTYDANGDAQSLGSGVVLPDGAVATNCHVIEDMVKIQVVYQSTEYPATRQYTDKDRDVCSLTVSGLRSPTVVMGDTSQLKVGARVYAIGAPKGLELTLSEGIISSLRPVAGGQYLQITAPISPGSSGGGLFDEEGRLIGLPTFYLTEGQQLNFAVPVEWIAELPKHHTEVVQSKKTLTRWLNQAIALGHRGDWEGLLLNALRWTKAQPREAVAWFSLGNAYGKSGQSTKEIEAYQQTLRLNPEYVVAWNNLGVVYWRSGQTEEAIQAYQQALRLDPEYADAWFNLGNAYGKSGLLEQAIKHYQQVLRLNPEKTEGWYGLGILYGKSGQTAKAIEAFQQALRTRPEYALAWYNLGVAYHASDQNGQVLEVFKRLKAIDPILANDFFSKVVIP